MVRVPASPILTKTLSTRPVNVFVWEGADGERVEFANQLQNAGGPLWSRQPASARVPPHTPQTGAVISECLLCIRSGRIFLSWTDIAAILTNRPEARRSAQDENFIRRINLCAICREPGNGARFFRLGSGPARLPQPQHLFLWARTMCEQFTRARQVSFRQF